MPERTFQRAFLQWEYGTDPAADYFERPESGLIVKFVPAVDVARRVVEDLVDQGVSVVELCGGFSTIDLWRVSEAVMGRAQIGAVRYGPESLAGASENLARALSKQWVKGALLFIDPGADPAKDRFAKSTPGGHLVFVAVPDALTASEVCEEMIRDQYGYIELFGGFSAEPVAHVLEQVAQRIPVGAVSYTTDAIQPA